eukprot:gnl/TRDRNA2_/TRDRNA2_92948_c0_seq1.p1 gnl/TRDRNA2_/TRDRNA2_92948_c0~~gnl/TRDRNA2_/TRDRNA2_92948_c0_seq1.p1  ORF type:complete len:426 (-),score=59.54 gnl/TRDRNA2_/TRDRNA2_92948_c0_seq1:83-1276(-)
MAEHARTREMDRFRGGETSVLICTNALEEGVDVSDCAFVIRFNKFDTTKSHIQGSGRARRHDAEVYYFSNNPDIEEQGAEYMTAVARDSSLALCESERIARKNHATKEVAGVYPFRAHTGAEVNFFNCLQIVYEYSQRTMQQSFDPQDLYTYSEEVVCAYPRQVRKYISKVAYPSPQGMQQVTLQDVNRHWGEVALDDVLDHERCRNMDARDKEQRRMLYVVVLKMHQKELLNNDNQPSAYALASTKLACPAFKMEPRINIRNAFQHDALTRDMPHAGGYPAYFSATESRHSSQDFLATTILGNASPAPSAGVGADSHPAVNFKSVLNEWALARQRRPANELIRYDTEGCSLGNASGFRSTVAILFLDRSFVGEVRSTKKAAEQAAAEVALRQLNAC